MGRSPKSKQPNRPHYIQEWATERGFKSQAELVRALHTVNKSTVSRWYEGASPDVEHQRALADLFECDEEDLFSPPEARWMRQFMAGRDPDEVARIKQSLELHFPRKTG